MTRRAYNAGGDLSEAAWQAQVLGLAGFYQWMSYHTHDSRRSAPGFPDLVLLRAPELLVVELKPDKATRRRATAAAVAARPEWLQHKDLRDEQAAWLEAFAALGAAVDEAVGIAQGAGGAYLHQGQTTDDAPSIEAVVWRPADFDVVQARLARGRNVVPMVDRAGA